MVLLDGGCHSFELSLFGFVNKVLVVFAGNWLVGRHYHHIQAIDLLELLCLSKGRTGHTTELLIQAEEILEGNSCQRHTLLLNGHAFFRFDRLVEAFVIAVANLEAASVLIDNDHLAIIGHHIVFVTMEERLGAQSLVDMVDTANILRGVQIFYTKEFLYLIDTTICQGHTGVLFIETVVLRHKLGSNLGKLVVAIRVLSCRRTNDEWSTRFIDQDRIHLVYNGKVELALTHQANLIDHIIAQVVEAKLVIRPIGDVCLIGFAPCTGAELLHTWVSMVLVGIRTIVEEGRFVNDHTSTNAQSAVDLPHPASVTLRQVVIDGHDMHTLALERIEVCCQSGHQGFTFTSLEFGHVAFV